MVIKILNLLVPLILLAGPPDQASYGSNARNQMNFSENPNEIIPHPSDVIDSTPELPLLSKWMLNSNGEIANWLGFDYQGKEVREPINVVVVIKESNPNEATRKLIDAMKMAGYTIQPGHSGGYRSYINHQLFEQYPKEWRSAFADEPASKSNNHARVFGPTIWNGSCVFSIAMSREDAHGSILSRWGILGYHHTYVSFSLARNDFSNKLVEQSQARIINYLDMQNALPTTHVSLTTGDHDGRAIIIELQK